MSPSVVPNGKFPASKSALVAKLIFPDVLILRNTEMVPPCAFPATRSNFPSPSMSPMARVNGWLPTVKGILLAKERVPTVLVLRRTDMVPAEEFAMAKSGFPSPSRSPTATACAAPPALESMRAAKLISSPLEVFLNKNTLLAVELVAARSNLPSPSKSSTATPVAPAFRVKLKRGLKDTALPVLLLRYIRIDCVTE